jgi:L-ascorbate metabolism protein UlaG (beta-lactamase superfamily)
MAVLSHQVAKIKMIGHCTVLIEAGGRRILTDPYFGLHGNPAYERVHPPAMRREDLQDVDLVLISHNHFDHRDRRYLRSLSASVPVLAPARTAWRTRLMGARQVSGVSPWERKSFGPVSVVAVPARHVTFTVGYVIEAEGLRIYFAGDTYFSDFMERIGRELKPDVALLPVTTYRIPMTMGEEGALRAVQVLAPATVIPIHLGIRPRLPLMRTGQTPEHFRERVQRAGLAANVVILREGESFRNADSAALGLCIPGF